MKEKNIKVKAPKILLACAIGPLLFALIIISIMLYQNENLSLILFPLILFVLPGLYLILAYFRQYLILEDTNIICSNILKKKTFSVFDIDRVIITEDNGISICVVFVGRSNEILYKMETTISKIVEVLEVLENNNIKIECLSDEISKEEIEKLPKKEKVNYNTKYNQEITSSKISESYYKKNRIFLRILGLVTLILEVLGFLFLSGKMLNLLFVLVILSMYGIYIYKYPYVYTEKNKYTKNNVLTLPLASTLIAILILISGHKYTNVSNLMYIKYLILFSLVLYIPFLLKIFIKKIKQPKLRNFSVLIAAVAIAVSILLPVNYMLVPKGNTTHINVKVIDKNVSSDEDEYYIYTDKEMYNKIEISKNLYEEIKVEDVVKICVKKSIIGFETWSVHK